MQIKRYEVLDIQDAIDLIKKDLGEDAVIISTRQVNNSNDLGFFGKPFLEVIAAVDYKEEDLKPSIGNDNFNQNLLRPLYDDVRFLKDNFESIVEDKVVFVVNEKFEDIQKSLDEIKFNLNLLKDEKTKVREKENDLLTYLDGLSFSRKISTKLIEVFFKDIKLINFKSEEKIDYFKKFFKKIIEKKIERKKLYPVMDNKIIIALVGNSGVGKTVTAAKLCSKLIFEKNMHLSVCSIDSIKIGGYETLKNYAKKLKIDFAALKNPEELKAFVSNSTSDVIIIDTFAVNHNSLYQLNNLSRFLRVFGGKIRVEILLQAQLKNIDAVRTYESFRNKVGVNSIIITKTDESHCLGNLAEIFLLTDSTVDFITKGENVPEDIDDASVQNIYSLFFSSPEY